MSEQPRRIKLAGRDREIVFDHDGERFRVAFYGSEWTSEGWRRVRRTSTDRELAYAIAKAMGEELVPGRVARAAAEYATAMGWTPEADPDELPPPRGETPGLERA